MLSKAGTTNNQNSGETVSKNDRSPGTIHVYHIHTLRHLIKSTNQDSGEKKKPYRKKKSNVLQILKQLVTLLEENKTGFLSYVTYINKF